MDYEFYGNYINSTIFFIKLIKKKNLNLSNKGINIL